MKHLITCFLIFQVLTAPAQSVGKVTLAWNPIANPIIAGYNIYYGGASRVYTNKMSAGLATSLTISNLATGSTYYFAATTYSVTGAESAMSSEVVYTLPVPPPKVQILVAFARQLVLTVSGKAGHTYDVQASQNLVTWTVIGTVTSGASGSETFTDTNSASFSSRFYRIVDTQP